MLTVIYSEEFLKHDTGRFHPEKPERLSAIVDALKTVPWSDRITWQLPTLPEIRDIIPILEQVHDSEYINQVRVRFVA